MIDMVLEQSLAVTVVIPTHLRATLLAEAIDSVLGQSLKASAIIVVDDADDPSTSEVVQAANLRSKVPVAYVVNRFTKGACGSRNLGASRSTTPFIAFLDDDDIWRETFLEEILGKMIDAGVDFVMSGLFRHEEAGPSELRCTPPGLTEADVVSDPRSMTGTNTLYRRGAFEAVGGFDVSVPVFNDWDLFIRLVDAGYRYDVVPHGLAEWRWHPGDRIASFSPKRAAGLRHFLKKYGHRMNRDTYRNFLTTAVGIERRDATGLRRFIKGAELVLAHGLGRSLSRLSKKLSLKV